jgi:hypothetical protein
MPDSETVRNEHGEQLVVDRFYRSTREAFPEERGQWFEPPERDTLWPLILGAVICLVMLVAAAWVVPL